MNNKGYTQLDSSEFRVAIPATNNGLVLVRGLNYAYENQEAKVYVNDEFAGTWLTAGKNESKTWREDLFIIPPEYTSGKENIHIKMIPLRDTWSEMYYHIHVLGSDAVIASLNETSEDQNVSIYPNPFNHEATVSFDATPDHEYLIEVVDVKGAAVQRYQAINSNTFKIYKGELENGLYFLNVRAKQGNNTISTTPFIISHHE